MEKLKSSIPETLILSISQSNLQTLPNTCSSLLHFFNQLPLFHQTIEDYAHTSTSLCLKDEESALEFKLKGNNSFCNGDYSNALRFYTEALRVAPRDVDAMGKNLVATLYVNRAAVLQKMGLFLESLRDCDRALAICRSYSKAWYRRAKANTSTGNFDDAVCDLKVSLCMERSVNGKRQIEDELKLILAQSNKKDFPPDVAKHKESDIHGNTRSSVSDQLQDIKLQCVETETKGRGMVSLTDIPQSTLLHAEEPYAAIIQNNYRKSHCHYCFNELPADIVPCSSCSMALYCSQLCQIHARGQNQQFHTKNHDIGFDLSSDLENYVSNVTKAIDDGVNINQDGEHKHECGVNWPTALPAVFVLGGRVIIKSIKQNGHFVNLELCNNYLHLHPEAKLELLISAIVLVKCLHHCYGSDVSLNGETISQCVLLFSQFLVNSMAIVRMRSADSVGPPNSTVNHTTVEQVRVGHAIYLAGSLYNHSCKPNIHTYFVSRTLYIRAIDFVAAGQPLELSYGPQVGEWSCDKRQLSLKEQYAFVCSCTACSQLNLPDLVINSYRCSNKKCSGVVLDRFVANYEQKVNPFLSGSPLQVDRVAYDEVKKVARLLCEETGSTHRVKPKFCLSCGAFIDLDALIAALSKVEIFLERLDGFLDSGECFDAMLSENLRHLDLLKSTLHPYNKKAAEAEDNIAQSFCSMGELQRSRDHCEASIKILEKLYGDEHIVIGNELVKLASIQLSLGEEHAVKESRNRINRIFSLHYGSHVDAVFPDMRIVRGDV
ncbi:uncharacterized protein LOC143627690 [Bidens hawaiensis]|uniref:uncharacterized protein LOC143627690 n=1 Tax=Bidens hawaiensis TaxID=980011 RepID=UPI00404AF117